MEGKVKGKGKLIVGGISVLMVVALVVGACAKAPAKPVVEEWVLTLVTPLTGGFASWGQEAFWAEQLAVEDINAAGGIAGKPVRLAVYDSGSDPAKAHVEMAKALDTKPMIVLLQDCADSGRASLNLTAAEGVMAIIPVSGVTSPKSYPRWAVSFMNYEDNWWGRTDVEACNREGFRTVVSVADNTIEDYVAAQTARCAYVESQGIEVVGEVNFEQFTMVDYAPVVVKALALEADAYMFMCMGGPVAKMAKEFYRRGMTEPQRLLISHACDYPELYEEGGDFVEGAYVESMYNINNTSERWQSVKSRYEAYTDVPMGLGVYNGYDIVCYVAAAIESTGVTGDPAKLAEEREMLANWCFNQEDYPFLMGDFDVVNGVTAGDLWLNRVEGGKKVVLMTIHTNAIPPARYSGPEHERPLFEP